MVNDGVDVTSNLVTGLKWLGWGLLGVFGLFLIGLLAIPPLTRSFTDTWGATPEEVAKPLPGDDLIDAKREVSTRAVSIDAPPVVSNRCRTTNHVFCSGCAPMVPKRVSRDGSGTVR